MTGPLTPPPSSAQEIQDAARASVPPETQAPPAVQEPVAAESAIQAEPQPAIQPTSGAVLPQLSVYATVYPALSQLASNGAYDEAIRLAETYDLLVRIGSDCPAERKLK